MKTHRKWHIFLDAKGEIRIGYMENVARVGQKFGPKSKIVRELACEAPIVVLARCKGELGVALTTLEMLDKLEDGRVSIISKLELLVELVIGGMKALNIQNPSKPHG